MPKTVELTMENETNIVMLRDHERPAKIARDSGIGLARVNDIWRTANFIDELRQMVLIAEYKNRLLQAKKKKNFYASNIENLKLANYRLKNNIVKDIPLFPIDTIMILLKS
ncbi:hypothetical protein CHS0354_016836 [Potamilus streckersoni]|uniref:Uncharacterized protein n=1 Tax=Potamilus streckersoni TaxID=2493646 RepID=A0AAE0W349_9BIVA|nr:hypothetical protein CHS0354_016836 [Potamilus streckersoni]